MHAALLSLCMRIVEIIMVALSNGTNGTEAAGPRVGPEAARETK
jgi:hypothetical protein